MMTELDNSMMEAVADLLATRHEVQIKLVQSMDIKLSNEQIQIIWEKVYLKCKDNFKGNSVAFNFFCWRYKRKIIRILEA